MLALFGPFEVQRGYRSLWQGGAGAVGEEELGGSTRFWSTLVLDPRSIGIECPEQSGSAPLEDTSAGSHSIPAQPSACWSNWSRKGTVPVPLCRASSHLLPLPFLQTSMSAPLTGPATTSASTPPAASSASATRATRSTGSPTAGVGRVGCVLAGCHPAGVGSPGGARGGQLLWDLCGHCPPQGRMGKVGSTHSPG